MTGQTFGKQQNYHLQSMGSCTSFLLEGKNHPTFLYKVFCQRLTLLSYKTHKEIFSYTEVHMVKIVFFDVDGFTTFFWS